KTAATRCAFSGSCESRSSRKDLAMRRLLAMSSLLGLVLLSRGWAMCCAPYDCDYPYVGGRWVRTNPSSGRVASVFDESGAQVEATSATASQPTPAQPPVQQPMSRPAPGTRSVIPRNLGDSYLP